MRRATLLLSFFGALGCGDRTELLLVLHQKGLRIGVDIEKTQVTIRDIDDPTQMANQFIDIDLCGDVETSGCRDLPVRLLLLPGEKFPDDHVRVQIDGMRSDTRVISNAVQFRFTRNERLRLDVVMHGNCLGRLDCAIKNQVCLEDGSCAALTPTANAVIPDLAAPDLSTPDLAHATDLAGADFSGVDLAGCCANRQCGVDPVCQMTCGPGCSATQLCDTQSGQCVACGAIGQSCCAGACPVSGTCDQGLCRDPTVVCGHKDEPCCMGGCVSGYVCNGTSCAHCGFSDELCCPPGGTRCVGTTLQCAPSGLCEPCGAEGTPCCGGGLASGTCSLPTLMCVAGMCEHCGAIGEQCCYPTLPACTGADAVCDSMSITCLPCGYTVGALCCNDDPRCRDADQLVCNPIVYPMTCFECGDEGEYCCDDTPPCHGSLLCTPPDPSMEPSNAPSTCLPPIVNTMDMARSDMARGDMAISTGGTDMTLE